VDGDSIMFHKDKLLSYDPRGLKSCQNGIAYMGSHYPGPKRIKRCVIEVNDASLDQCVVVVPVDEGEYAMLEHGGGPYSLSGGNSLVMMGYMDQIHIINGNYHWFGSPWRNI